MAIVDAILEHARSVPSRPALVSRTGTWSYGDLMTASREMRDGLLSNARQRGRVAIVMTAEGEAVAALLAALAADASVILLPLGFRPSDLLHHLAVARAQVILLPPAAHGFRFAVGASKPVTMMRRVMTISLRGRDEPGTDSEAWIMQLTSGSLGPSRLAVRTSSGVDDEIRAVSERLDLTTRDTILCTSSLAHSYGLCGGLLAGLAAGATVVLSSARETIIETLYASQPTVVFGLVSTYQDMLDSPVSMPVSAQRHVGLALCAGAPLPVDVFTQVKDRFGLSIRQDYGTTETGTIAIDTSASPRPSQAGVPLPHLEVRLSPFEATGATEILIRSPSTAHIYLGRHGPVPCLDNDGWYHTGDAGRMDDEGRLVVGRRLRPRVQIGSAWIDPEEVERRIGESPGVHEVAVLTVRSKDGQHHLRAVVVAPELTMDDVHRWCRENLSPEQQPALLELRHALPRSPAGKILHKHLLDKM